MAAVEPTVWTLKEFKKQSTPSDIRKRGRGPHLQLIDRCVEDFHKHRTTLIWAEKKKRAYDIVQACRLWIANKANKTSTNTANRRTAVNTLGAQAWAYLQYWEFEHRKAIEQTTQGLQGQGHALRPGYAPERTMYLQSGKNYQPISGSYMHEAAEDPRAAALIGAKTFSQLTVMDYHQLDQNFNGMVAAPGSPPAQVNRRVMFLPKQERMKLLLMVMSGELWSEYNTPYDTFAGRAYVMDEYGNLYSTEAVLTKPGSGLNFNHSTLNAGKDVICAGIIEVKKGKLRSINNNSGHYKPTRQNLHNAMLVLNRQGLDWSQCTVTVSEPDPTRPGKMVEHDYNNAAAFIANPNAAPDNSYQQP